MNQHIHLIGIGGTGMGPLAKILLEMGCQVSGSDLERSETTSYLEELGARIYYEHNGANIVGASSVVYSTAIPPHNPEVVAAKEQGIMVYHRSEMLAQLLNERRGIAVGGAHGKTTITSMISWILEQAGIDPTVLIGARFAPFGPGAKYGESAYMVAEADESDRSFLRYRPEVGIVTNIEADHLENYDGAFKQLVKGYHQFVGNIKPGGVAILGVDDPLVEEIANKTPTAITYGFSPKADWRATINEQKEGVAHYRVWKGDQVFGDFTLTVPGSHNVCNSLAAIIVGDYIGLRAEEIAKPLHQFKGAQRRFQIIGEPQETLIVDDYAHHPTEVAATIKAAKDGWGRRVIAVFQPHRYTRTSFLMDEFASSFYDADQVVLTDIYSPPPEQPIPGVSSQVLAEKIRAKGCPVHLVPQQDALAGFLQNMVKPGDIVLTMGAGSIWKTAYELRDLLMN